MPRAADAEVELRPDLPLLGVGALEARTQLGIRRGCAAPALDAAVRLDPRDRRDEPGAGQVVRRREGLAGVGVGGLLGDGREPVRAANRDTAKRARRAAKLPGNDSGVVHLIIVSVP